MNTRNREPKSKPQNQKSFRNPNLIFCCPYCLSRLPLSQSSIEHEPPQSRQNECGESKVILACKQCNNEKSALTETEYTQWKQLNKIRGGKTGTDQGNLSDADFAEFQRLNAIRNGLYKQK